MRTLNDLLVHQIQDLHSGESQILDALPDMIEAASDKELKAALKEHRDQTERHRQRLEGLASALGAKAVGEECQGMKGVIEEGQGLVTEEAETDEVRDAAIITACQRIEHYEMAGYGSARSFARRLGEDSVANVLQEILDEEKNADSKLTRLAEAGINTKAMA